MITLIHPSRQRAFKAFNTCAEWLNKSSGKHEIEYILSVDNDDPELPQYCEYFKTEDNSIKILMNDNRSCVDAVNIAAKESLGNILIVVSDDMFPLMEEWDDLIAKEVEGKEDYILKVHDGTHNWLITLPIVDRAFYNRYGYIYDPDIQHLFCDTIMTAIGDLTGRTILANHLKFEHKHWTTEPDEKKREEILKTDPLYKRLNSTWAQGETVFLRKFKNNFGLLPEQIKGKITDQPMIDWLKSKGIRI